jgi:hypothetical protein
MVIGFTTTYVLHKWILNIQIWCSPELASLITLGFKQF